MKLSELVAFRNKLNELSLVEPQKLAQSKLDIIMHTIEFPANESINAITNSFTPELHNNLTELYQVFDKFSANVEQVKKQVQELIGEQEKQWFQESYKLFELAKDCETTDQILHHRSPTGEKSEQAIEAELTLRSRLGAYSDWRWPGMIIRPALETYIDTMVGCDPLYIIDREHDLLQPCLKRFPKLYQNRLRPYTTNDWSDSPILERIPNNQFGVCLAYNVFNHRPLEIIRRYLEEVYQKLRPGGALLMTYNDCDRWHGVVLVEQFAASYTPGYLIRDLAQTVGFEQVYAWDDGGPSVWLELRKPGKLESIRGGQAISTINQIDNYLEDVDFNKRRHYTSDEFNDLKDLAKKYGINEEVIQSSKPYDLKVMIDEIARELFEKERLEKLRQEAVDFGIDPNASNLEELVILERQKNLAKIKKVDINLPNWQDKLEEVLIEEEIVARKRQEQERIANLRRQAEQRGIDLTLPDWLRVITEILLKEDEESRRIVEEARIIKLKEKAQERGIDVTQPNWELLLRKAIEKEEFEERQRLKEIERQRIEKFHNMAREHGVDPTQQSEEETMRLIAEEIDRRKKVELAQLRIRAMELQAGDPNLIKYGYSAEKLKQLIKEKEEGK